MQRAFLACGSHRLDVAEELQLLIDAVADAGLNIFTARISALGLHPSKIRQLYFGSSDFQKYSNQTPAHVGGICSAGQDLNGVTQLYIDDSVNETAGHALREQGRIADLKPLFAEGLKELTKAQKMAA